MRILSFDVSSSFAQFRKNYTTTSALTFSIPTPSSLRGLVGAIIGLRYDEAYDKLQSARFGVQVLSKISKARIMINLINTEHEVVPLGISGSPRIQVRYEYVRAPRYRIYFHSPNDGIMDRLADMLNAHKSYFTPYLGVAYCIADFQFVGNYEANPIRLSKENAVLTAVPKKWISNLSIQSGHKYMIERMPIAVDMDRTPKGYIDLVFDAGGNPLSGTFTEPMFDLGSGKYIALI